MAAMNAPFRELAVRLHRDALNTPWGFRLQGGRDFKAPLTVQRVFVGSPADGELQRGDVILDIENHDTSNLMHKQAQDIIKSAGGSVSLRVKRGAKSQARAASPPRPAQVVPQSFRSRPLDSGPATTAGAFGFVPKPRPQMAQPSAGPSFGVDYSQKARFGPVRPPPDSMLNRVSASLNNAIWQPGMEQGDPEYETRPVSQLKQLYGQPNQPPPSRQRSSGGGRRWRKPETGAYAVPSGLADPGWIPGSGRQGGGGWAPVQGPGSPVNAPSYQDRYRPAPMPVYRQPPPPPAQPAQSYVPRHEEPEPPAWAGTLKSSGGPKPWEVAQQAAMSGETYHPPSHAPVQAPRQLAGPRPEDVQPHHPAVQSTHFAPGQAPMYETRGDEPSDTARVAHLQYNTPIGLYSRENVDAALRGQTAGKPGEGTMIVTGGHSGKNLDLSKSEVYRMIQEQEHQKARTRGGGAPTSARYQEQPAGQEVRYEGYVDHRKQSPSMYALEHNVVEAGGEGEEFGTSDF